MRLKTYAGSLAAIALCAVPAAHFASPPHEPPRGPYQVPLLPRLEFLKVIGAGQRPMVTDYFWLQAIQAAGRGGLSTERTRWLDLYYYADLVTDLDPKFKKVYVYAGTAIPTNIGRETYVNVDEGLKILKKGLDAFPDDWQIAFYYGANLSYLKKEHKEAAHILEKVAKMPDAPAESRELATRLLAVTGDFEAAYAVVEAAERNESDPRIRKSLEIRRLEIAQEATLQAVDKAIAAYRADHDGKLPPGGSISALVDPTKPGYLREFPVDPISTVPDYPQGKGSYIYIGKDGRAYSTGSEERFMAIDAEYRRHQKYGDETDGH